MGELFAQSRIRNLPMERVPVADSERGYLLRSGDLLFARQSLVLAGAGKCSVFLGDDEPVTYEGHIIRARIDQAVADPLFYYYFFNSRPGRNAIASIVEQVAAAGIRGSDLGRLRVPYPDKIQQRAISRILGTLDDKIELNRRMNDTLEAMARALFKSWFVDFDPVRAKAEGRDTGLPAHLAALFPSQIVDSELGPIPAGWSTEPIGKLALVAGGSTPSTSVESYWGGEHAWATPKDLARLSVPVLLETERSITDEGIAQISSGLLPAGTVLMSSRAPIGYLAIAEIPVSINQGFIAMRATKRVSNLFLLRWAQAAQDVIVSRANGSTFLEISKASFRPISVATPPQPVTDAFDRVSRPLYLRVVGNERESRTLAALRDAVLPKLMSGDIRVKEAERIAEAAV